MLSEPTLTASPWFEARRDEYHGRLLAISSHGDWDGYIRFFALGLREAVESTRAQMIALVEVQSELKEVVRNSTLRADSAHAVIDLAVANPSFTLRQVETDLGLLRVAHPIAYKRRFYAPRLLRVPTQTTT